MDNLDLFKECLQNPEPLVDPCYCNDTLIISKNSTEDLTEIMKVNAQIIDRITTIGCLLEDNPEADISTHVKVVEKLLKTEFSNFIEFTSFFPAMDVSFSIYKKLSSDKRIEFLSTIIKKYINKRHFTYKSHGYSPVSIQVRKDFEKHKTGGGAANTKYSKILLSNGFSEAKNHADFFDDTGNLFVSMDKGNVAKPVIQQLKCQGLKFEWQANHSNKDADMIIKASGKFYICEFKHMKEGGGGQDKQVIELIDFIEQTESINVNVSYVSLMDGIYFDHFKEPKERSKDRKHLERITETLGKTKTNYFINTYGFRTLFNCPQD